MYSELSIIIMVASKGMMGEENMGNLEKDRDGGGEGQADAYASNSGFGLWHP